MLIPIKKIPWMKICLLLLIIGTSLCCSFKKKFYPYLPSYLRHYLLKPKKDGLLTRLKRTNAYKKAFALKQKWNPTIRWIRYQKEGIDKETSDIEDRKKHAKKVISYIKKVPELYQQTRQNVKKIPTIIPRKIFISPGSRTSNISPPEPRVPDFTYY